MLNLTINRNEMRSLTRCFTILFLLLSVFSCKDDSSGKTAQVAPVSNVRYKAAQGALLFQWDNPQQDDLTYVEISYTDKSGNLHRTLVLEGLSERWVEGIPDNSAYNFRFLVYDKAGNSSEPVDVMASALESTVNMFYGRVKLGVDFSGINVSWENNYDENFFVELTYTDLNGNDYKEEVVVAANSEGKQFVKIGASLSGSQSLDVYAIIVDENGNESEQKVLKFYKKEVGKLDRSAWKVASFSSQEENAPATNLLDGDINTQWHSRWSTNKAPYPHYVVFDLGTKKQIEKIGIYQRQSVVMVKGVAIYGNNVSAAPSDESMWNLCYEFDLSTELTEQIFEFPDIVAYRYIKIVCTSPAGVGGDDSCAALGEVYLYGADIADE